MVLCISHCSVPEKNFMIHQTFVQWALYNLFKFVKSLVRHLGPAIGNVWCVQWFSWTLHHLTKFQANGQQLKSLKSYSSNIIQTDRRTDIQADAWNNDNTRWRQWRLRVKITRLRSKFNKFLLIRQINTDISHTASKFYEALAWGACKPKCLTHWGRNKNTAILRTFSNVFSWMKMYEFWLKFHWILFLRVQLTIFQHWFR